VQLHSRFVGDANPNKELMTSLDQALMDAAAEDAPDIEVICQDTGFRLVASARNTDWREATITGTISAAGGTLVSESFREYVTDKEVADHLVGMVS